MRPLERARKCGVNDIQHSIPSFFLCGENRVWSLRGGEWCTRFRYTLYIWWNTLIRSRQLFWACVGTEVSSFRKSQIGSQFWSTIFGITFEAFFFAIFSGVLLRRLVNNSYLCGLFIVATEFLGGGKVIFRENQWWQGLKMIYLAKKRFFVTLRVDGVTKKD